MYDGDSAGIHAALRGINLVLAEGLNVKVVLLPDGEDPDSYGRKHTLAEMQQFIADSERDFIEFKTDLLLSQAGRDPLKRAELINDIADTIAEIPDPVKRSVYVDTVAVRFGIESAILFERISNVRRRKQEEAARDRQRSVRDASGDSDGGVASGAPLSPHSSGGEGGYSDGVVVTGGEPYLENRTLAPAERDLLFFLLRYGTEPLVFESDSPYYTGEEDEDRVTVADFIREALEADDGCFANTAYKALYDRYMALYDEGRPQEAILKAVLDGEDRALANLAASLSTEKYQLTVGAFEASLTSTTSFLTSGVPKAIMVYAERRVQDRLDTIRRSLASVPAEEQLPLMQEMLKLQAAQRRIRQKIGREKTDKK
jgi:DNA primase